MRRADTYNIHCFAMCRLSSAEIGWIPWAAHRQTAAVIPGCCCDSRSGLPSAVLLTAGNGRAVHDIGGHSRVGDKCAWLVAPAS